MADKFPNIPGITVGIRDGSLRPETPPAGPTVVVLGTAKKGPSKTENRVSSGPTALARFGLSGTLGRGIVEVFQGGGDNVLAYRVLATKAKLSHIGDASGAAGYTVESVGEGSDALAKLSVLYDNEADILEVFDTASGQIVYSNDPDAPLNLGVVEVTGEKAADNLYGSIGKVIKLRTDESLQKAARSDDETLIVETTNNLSLLRWHAATNPCKVQVLSGLSGATEKTAVRLATAAALSACTYHNGNGTLTANATGVEQIDSTAVALNNRVLVKNQAAPVQNGLYFVSVVGEVGVAQVLTRVTDANAADEFSEGMYVDVTAGSANAGKSFCLTTDAPGDGYVLGTTELAFAEINPDPDSWLVEANVTAVDTAAGSFTIDQDVTALAFPALKHKVRFMSSVLGQRADKILHNRLFASESAAVNGGVQSLVVLPGSDFNGLPKVDNDLGWAADVEDSEGVLASEEVLPAKMNLYEGMEDAFLALEAAEFSVIVMPGVYANDPALDGRTAGATALPDEALEDIDEVTTIAGFADRVDVTFDDADARTAAKVVLNGNGRGGFWAVFTSAQGPAFGENLTEGELVRTARVLNWADDANDDTVLRLFFDRDVSFSVDSDGVVAASANPLISVYQTDLLFYHRSAEVDGTLRHMWYPETSDEDGFTYSQVNFAYRLSKFCQEMTENEIAINGVIGVRPPTNHFSPAALAQWIGKSPTFFEGDVSVNGTGLLGNKFVAGMLMEDDSQFDPGYKATQTGELDDDEILLDGNNFEVDMGKFLSTVASWPILSNDADSSGLGYINSGASLYAGLLAGLPSWRGATAKFIGGRGIRLPMKLAKRHQDSLTKARYVVFDQRPEGVIVVDAPSSALPTSDFTRNMTVRLVSDAVKVCRDVSRPFLGDPLSGLKKAGLETAIKKGLSDLQRASGGALEAFTMSLTQTALDKIRGTAKLTLTLTIINELRKITVDVALAQ